MESPLFRIFVYENKVRIQGFTKLVDILSSGPNSKEDGTNVEFELVSKLKEVSDSFPNLKIDAPVDLLKSLSKAGYNAHKNAPQTLVKDMLSPGLTEDAYNRRIAELADVSNQKLSAYKIHKAVETLAYARVGLYHLDLK